MPSPAVSNNAQLAPRARFACYPAQFSAFRPRTQTLTDQLHAKLTLSVDFPDTVCAPAPEKSSGYLTCYRATINSTNLPSAIVHGSDEFGPIDARVSAKGMTLCVPSTRIDATPGTTAKVLDPFTCYPTSRASIGRTGVIVADEFGSAADTITARAALCAPAAISGGGPTSGGRPADPAHDLSCYSVGSEVKGTSMIMKDQFGLLKAALGVRSRLCTTVTVRPY
jgi:hypothetical protein